MDILVRNGRWWITQTQMFRWGPDDELSEEDCIIEPEPHRNSQSVYSFRKYVYIHGLYSVDGLSLHAGKPIPESVWIWEYSHEEARWVY